MNQVEQWLKRKLGTKAATIREVRTVTKEYKKNLGPRGSYASVSLTITPAKEFSFSWAEEPSEIDYRSAIEDAVFAALLTEYTKPILGLSVRINKVIEHPVDSSYFAFKCATAEAMEEALNSPIETGNIVWPAAL